MPRGYRRYILAAFGWLILTGQSPKDAVSSQKPEAAESVTKQLERVASALEKADASISPDSGCPDRQEDRNSDLCAQWKAADATRETADVAWLQLWPAWVGVILGGVTMVAAIFAALYARRAAVATEETVGIAREASKGAAEALAISARSADAAARANEIAADAIDLDRRPWLLIEQAILDDCADHGMVCSYRGYVTVNNVSNSIALNVKIYFGIYPLIDKPPRILPGFIEPERNWGNQAIYEHLLQPATPGLQNIPIQGGFEMSSLQANGSVFLAVRVEYTSPANGKVRHVAQRFHVARKDKSSEVVGPPKGTDQSSTIALHVVKFGIADIS